MVLAATPRADLPWSIHIAVGLAFLVGLMIWLAGGRLMRPAFIALGAIIGASLAHLIPEAVDQAVGRWVVIAVGALLGILFGWLAFRVLVAGTLGIVVSIVSALGVTAFVHLDPPEDRIVAPVPAESAEPAPDSEHAQPVWRPRSMEEWILSLQLDRLKESAAKVGAEARAAMDEAESDDADLPGSIADLTVKRGSRAIKAFAARSWEQLVRFWNLDLDPRGRALILLALCVGFLGGLVLGLALPKRAAAVTTAMIGPAVWMPAAAYLMVAAGLPLARQIPADPLLWLLAWVVLAGLGLLLQLLGSRRSSGASSGG